MKEEQVTKKIISELVNKGFTIKAFDYPQSGTGVILYPRNPKLPKINLDIIAVKDDKLWVFENKDRFYKKDFEKLKFLRENLEEYKDAFKVKLGLDLEILDLKTFIGLPKKAKQRVKDNYYQIVDGVWGV